MHCNKSIIRIFFVLWTLWKKKEIRSERQGQNCQSLIYSNVSSKRVVSFYVFGSMRFFLVFFWIWKKGTNGELVCNILFRLVNSNDDEFITISEETTKKNKFPRINPLNVVHKMSLSASPHHLIQFTMDNWLVGFFCLSKTMRTRKIQNEIKCFRVVLCKHQRERNTLFCIQCTVRTVQFVWLIRSLSHRMNDLS